jgi:hypothetical protein
MVPLQDYGRRNGEGSSYAHDRPHHGYDRPHHYDPRLMYNDRYPYGRGGPSSEEDDRAIALALAEEEQYRECHVFMEFLLWMSLAPHIGFFLQSFSR